MSRGKGDRSLPGEGRRVVPMIGCIPGESKGSKKGLTERRLLILAVSSPLLSIKTHPRDYHKYARPRCRAVVVVVSFSRQTTNLPFFLRFLYPFKMRSNCVYIYRLKFLINFGTKYIIYTGNLNRG